MLETLSETCGFKTFMSCPPSAAALGRSLAALAAVLPEVVGERPQGRVVGCVMNELALAARSDKARVHQPVEVVVQGCPWNFELRLQVGGRDSLGAALHDGSYDGQAGWVAERRELQRMITDLTISIILDL